MIKLILLPFKIMFYPIIFILGFGSAICKGFNKHDKSKHRR